MKNRKKIKQSKHIEHRLGDKHFIDGIACVTKYINNKSAWVSPELDDLSSHPLVLKGLVVAKIDQYGKITLL